MATICGSAGDGFEAFTVCVESAVVRQIGVESKDVLVRYSLPFMQDMNQLQSEKAEY